MAFSGLTLTAAGRAVLAQAQAGKTLSFAYVAVGDGTYNGSFTDLTALKHQLYTVNFGNLKVSDDGTCTLEADITNQGLEEGYYLREIGIFVKSGEDDVLYLYDNAGNDAEYINASEETMSIEKRLRFQIQVSGVEDITLSQQSVLYLPQKDFEDFVDHGNISNTVIDYTVPESEEEPEPGEKTGTFVGKIVKKLSVLKSSLSSHTGNKSNPHGVTKAQVGLGNVDNTADKDKPISTAVQQALDAHTGDTNNPHGVTKTQVGLSNVDNTSDANKPISTATQQAIAALNTELGKKALANHTHTAAQVTDLSGASVNYANSAGSATAATSAAQVDGEKVKVWSDSEGGNVALTAPDGTRWEIDAYNGNLRIFNYGSGTPGITVTKAGQISDKAGNRLDNKSDKGHTHDDRYYTQSAIKSMLRSSNGNGTINTAYLKSSSYATWRLWGQMVFVTFYFEGSTPPGNGAALVTGGLPTPVGNAECCLVSNNANPAFRVRLESNGQLVRFYGGALNNGEIASGTMTYITLVSIA